MANARKLDKRRKSIRSIRKITRTMELIANARFKRAMDRATAADGLHQANDPAGRRPGPKRSGGQPPAAGKASRTQARHPAGTDRQSRNVRRLQFGRAPRRVPAVRQAERGIAASGNRGLGKARDHRLEVSQDHPASSPTRISKINPSMPRSRNWPTVTWTNSSRPPGSTRCGLHPLCQQRTAGTGCGNPAAAGNAVGLHRTRRAGARGESMYEFLPSAESILEEVVPTSFRVKLFKCFLDAAVSEQIARMVAMKAATENADDIIRKLSMNLQPRPPVADHGRNHGNHRRRRGAELMPRHNESETSFTPHSQASDRGSTNHGNRYAQYRTHHPDHRLDVRRRVRRGQAALDLQCGLKVDSEKKGVKIYADRRSATAPGRRTRPLRGPGQHRRTDARPGVRRYRRAGVRPRRQPIRSAASSTCWANPLTVGGPVKADEYRPIHQRVARSRGAVHHHGAVRNGHQGHRPADAVRTRW